MNENHTHRNVKKFRKLVSKSFLLFWGFRQACVICAKVFLNCGIKLQNFQKILIRKHG
jgi:hypothetical protein